MDNPLDIEPSSDPLKVAAVKPLLQKLWEDNSTKDLTLKTSNTDESIKCHAAIFKLASWFTNDLVTSSEGHACIQFLDTPLQVIRDFLLRLYCLETGPVVDSSLDSLVKTLRIENTPSCNVKKPMSSPKPGFSNLVRSNNAFGDDEKSDKKHVPKPVTTSQEEWKCEECLSCTFKSLGDFAIHKAIHHNSGKMMKKAEQNWGSLDPLFNDCDPDHLHISMKGSQSRAKVKVKAVLVKCEPDIFQTEETSVSTSPNKTSNMVDCVKCSRVISAHDPGNRKLVSLNKGSADGSGRQFQYICSNCLNLGNTSAVKRKLCVTCQTLYPIDDHHSCSKGSGELKCDFCPSTYTTLGSLTIHKATKHPNQVPSLVNQVLCTKCNKPFNMFRKQSADGENICLDCMMECAYETPTLAKKSDKKHVPKPITTSQEEWKCEECLSCTFKSLGDFSIHKAIHHNSGKMMTAKPDPVSREKIQCPRCPAMIRQDRIQSHDIQCHHESATYACDQCDFRSWTENGLKHHYGRLHTTNKIACVNGCGSMFNQKCSMVDHTRRYCKLAPASEKEKYRQMDIDSGRIEIKRMKTKQKTEQRNAMIRSLAGGKNLE